MTFIPYFPQTRREDMEMNDPAKLKSIIRAAAITLKNRINWADPLRLLGALAEVESSFGLEAVPRHEKLYDILGIYWNRELWRKWGSLSACSYSSFQIMYPVCIEMGMDPNVPPWHLMDDESAMPWVLEYINKRIIVSGCTRIEDFADTYNSGTFKDQNIPFDYISKFTTAYQGVIEKYNLGA